jgi:hypothetical protein
MHPYPIRTVPPNLKTDLVFIQRGYNRVLHEELVRIHQIGIYKVRKYYPKDFRDMMFGC